MVLYTSALTTAVIDSPARRAQTGGTRSTGAYPPAVMQRRLHAPSASHAAGAQPPALWLAADSALPTRNRLCITVGGSRQQWPSAACLSPPGGRVDTLSSHRSRVYRHRNCFSRLFFAAFLFWKRKVGARRGEYPAPNIERRQHMAKRTLDPAGMSDRTAPNADPRRPSATDGQHQPPKSSNKVHGTTWVARRRSSGSSGWPVRLALPTTTVPGRTTCHGGDGLGDALGCAGAAMA